MAETEAGLEMDRDGGADGSASGGDVDAAPSDAGDGKTIILAAGGTGGHLFPAFALAQELSRRGYAVDLMTDMRGDRYGTGFPARTVHKVPSATLKGKSPIALAKTALTLSRGVAAARRIMSEVRPSVVVGFGGYPSFPPLMAARMKGIKTILHEQNAVLGRANRLLAKRVDAVATSFAHTKYLEGSALADKARHTGNPVRDNVLAAASVPYPELNDSERINLLIFGGSQGARYFSETLPTALKQLPDDLRSRIVVIQQARSEDIDGVRMSYANGGITARVETFFADLPAIIGAAHLVIARAGASSIAELTVIGRPSVLVPLPHALDNDQLLNATRLAESGGAWCVEQGQATADWFQQHLTGVLRHPSGLIGAAAAAKACGLPDAVRRLADLVEELAITDVHGVPA
ncbi:MAG: undecaprenyldiphospho-muramoylpentapeptide beta-N-acetylglucosaminyltransferase [Pseudomonadota bacterium]